MRCSFELYLPINTGKTAGTESSRTLPIVLNALLDTPHKHLVTLVILPLKHLQITQENDFNKRYGIPTVVINEDTPREDAWWTVSYELLTFSYCDNPIAIVRKMFGAARCKPLVLLDS